MRLTRRLAVLTLAVMHSLCWAGALAAGARRTAHVTIEAAESLPAWTQAGSWLYGPEGSAVEQMIVKKSHAIPGHVVLMCDLQGVEHGKTLAGPRLLVIENRRLAGFSMAPVTESQRQDAGIGRAFDIRRWGVVRYQEPFASDLWSEPVWRSDLDAAGRGTMLLSWWLGNGGHALLAYVFEGSKISRHALSLNRGEVLGIQDLDGDGVAEIVAEGALQSSFFEERALELRTAWNLTDQGFRVNLHSMRSGAVDRALPRAELFKHAFQ